MNADHLKPWFTVAYQLFNIGIFASQFLSPTAVGACIFPVNLCMSNWVVLMSLSPCVKIVTMSIAPKKSPAIRCYRSPFALTHAACSKMAILIRVGNTCMPIYIVFLLAKSAITKSVTSLGIMVHKKNSVGDNAIFLSVDFYRLMPFKLGRTFLHKCRHAFFKVVRGCHLHLVHDFCINGGIKSTVRHLVNGLFHRRQCQSRQAC